MYKVFDEVLHLHMCSFAMPSCSDQGPPPPSGSTCSTAPLFSRCWHFQVVSRKTWQDLEPSFSVWFSPCLEGAHIQDQRASPQHVSSLSRNLMICAVGTLVVVVVAEAPWSCKHGNPKQQACKKQYAGPRLHYRAARSQQPHRYVFGGSCRLLRHVKDL